MNQLDTHVGLPPPLRVVPDMPANWHNTDTDFDTAAEQLVQAHQADGEARDLPVSDLRTWGVKAEDGRFALEPLARHQPCRTLRSNAFTNLAARLGAPAEFIRDKLTAPLQLAVLNFLIASAEKPLSASLRLRGDEISAVVSDRYAPLDAEELVDAVRNALVQQGALQEVRVRALATGLTDVLRLTFPGEQVAVKVGDVTHVGLDISTSSFARSAVHVRGLLWRLVCTNGLRAPSRMGDFSFRHVGESQRLKDGLHDAIPTALAHAKGFMGQWQRAVGVFIDNVAAEIERMRELTIGERKGVEQELLTEAGIPQLPERTSAYDLVNAVTAAARQAEPARRLELEGYAGQLLERQVGAA